MVKVEFETENAAFDESSYGASNEERARILRHVAEKIEQGFTSGPCIDSNGNTVGSWTA